MQDQIFPSITELKAEFNRRKASYRDSFAENGTARAIEALSKAIRDLRDIGANVQLHLYEAVPEEVFSLMEAVSSAKGGRSVSISGILKIDQDEHLLCVSTKEESKAALKIYVSDRNYASKHIQHDFRGACFDMNNDAEAMLKFQKYVLSGAAENEIIREHDVANSLDFDEYRIARLPKPKF